MPFFNICGSSDSVVYGRALSVKNIAKYELRRLSPVAAIWAVSGSTFLVTSP
jgi:hypothetical protein